MVETVASKLFKHDYDSGMATESHPSPRERIQRMGDYLKQRLGSTTSTQIFQLHIQFMFMELFIRNLQIERVEHGIRFAIT
jgi:hypothetical protein